MAFDLKDLLENLNDGVYFVDRSRKIVYWNKMAQEITDYSADEVIGARCSDDILMHVDDKGNHLCNGMCPLAETIADGVSRKAEAYLHHKKGHRIPVLLRTTPLKNDRGEIIGAAELFTDISVQMQLKEKIDELETLAMLDHLTRLPNRHYIEQELQSSLEEMSRARLFFGVIFLDIDGFKVFNDDFGHSQGDRVLRIVANTLKASSRPYDIFGRWGGEEFLGIIRNVDLQLLFNISERYRILIENSTLRLNNRILGITVSIGATMARETDTISSIVHRADSLMYDSKQSGKNRITIDSILEDTHSRATNSQDR